MGAMASQLASLTIAYSIVYSGADQRNIKAPRHRPLCAEFTGNAENVSIRWRNHVKLGLLLAVDALEGE